MRTLCRTHKRDDGSGEVSYSTVVKELLKLDHFKKAYAEIKKERKNKWA